MIGGWPREHMRLVANTIHAQNHARLRPDTAVAEPCTSRCVFEVMSCFTVVVAACVEGRSPAGDLDPD